MFWIDFSIILKYSIYIILKSLQDFRSLYFYNESEQDSLKSKLDLKVSFMLNEKEQKTLNDLLAGWTLNTKFKNNENIDGSPWLFQCLWTIFFTFVVVEKYLMTLCSTTVVIFGLQLSFLWLI